MGLIDRIVRVIRANISSLVANSEDPEKVLEQTLSQMQDELVQLRQALAGAIATQKRTERQHDQARSTADEWYRRAELALLQGDEKLAREALRRRQSYQETVVVLGGQLQQQFTVVDKLKQNTRSLEAKIADVKTKKDLYIARARSARASAKLAEMLGQLDGGSGSVSAFDRMEDKVIELEARSAAFGELAGEDWEQKFAALETASDRVETDLAGLKAQVLSGTSQPASPPTPPAATTPGDIDSELEKIRSHMNNQHKVDT
ncbi:MAG TPA: PspA/IM30 family protein [Oscillatoriaceae cyanobacterium M33_DOE_052]|uniref:PspA/IM30 family protein n=1 Tax=Planktothricoides sp. SpSt-374 TaxID=2282167 RepID=A0A7C3VFD3_9CYAN|nr:PspA/IM30 family protein [Oscillatoriaceae cyanobacterium M33_DOE_052]